MIPKVFKENHFIDNVTKKTEDDELSWTEIDSTAYFCNHKNQTLHISSFFNPDREEGGFRFRYNVDEKSTVFTVRDDENDYVEMSRLYEAVIANANNVTEDIKNFFD